VKTALIIAVLSTANFLFSNEPSAFSAGDINNKNPYGLTKNEKHILTNKSTIKDVRSRLFLLESSVDEINAALDGIRSVSRGQNESRSKLNNELHSLQDSFKINSDIATATEDNFNNIHLKLDEYETLHTQLIYDLNASFYTLRDALNKVKHIVIEVNNNYISKTEFQHSIDSILDEIGTLKTNQNKLAKGGVVAKSTISTKSLHKYSKKELLKLAKNDIKAKQYKSAKKYLIYLAKSKGIYYAPTMFWLGEVYYQTGNYHEAISAFKTSVKENDSAGYIPTLLFHTGVSFQKLAKKGDAIQFFEMLIQLYPKSYLIKSAKKRLKKLST
jgi:TolA-binding protein